MSSTGEALVQHVRDQLARNVQLQPQPASPSRVPHRKRRHGQSHVSRVLRSFLTRVEQARPELATFAALDWLPLAELPDDPGPVLPATIDTRFTVDGYDLGWAEADGEATAQAVRHLGEADPDALFVYLGNPDETSHQNGSIGPEYRGAIALADRQVGMLINAIRARPARPPRTGKPASQAA